MARQRHPVYAVFEQRPWAGSTDHPNTCWVLIAEHIQASTVRDAITQATAGRDPADRDGTYWAVLQRHVRPTVRATETRTVEVWTHDARQSESSE